MPKFMQKFMPKSTHAEIHAEINTEVHASLASSSPAVMNIERVNLTRVRVHSCARSQTAVCLVPWQSDVHDHAVSNQASGLQDLL